MDLFGSLKLQLSLFKLVETLKLRSVVKKQKNTKIRKKIEINKKVVGLIMKIAGAQFIPDGCGIVVYGPIGVFYGTWFTLAWQEGLL